MNNQTLDNNRNYAGFWIRFISSGIDSLMLLIVGMGISLSLGVENPFFPAPETFLEVSDVVISNIVFVLYYIIFLAQYDGATPAGKLLGIKVVRTNGEPMNYGVAFVRYLGLLLATFPFGLGLFWISYDKQKQGWHDKFAQTYVVKTSEKPRWRLAIFLFSLSVFAIVGVIIIYMLQGW